MNLYAYCFNNPVMYTDHTGHFIISLFISSVIAGAIVGGVIGGISAYETASDSGKSGSKLVVSTALGIVFGGLVGGGVGAIFGAVAPLLAGGIGSGGTLALAGGGIVSAGATSALGVSVEVGIAMGVAVSSGIVMMATIGKSGGYRVDHYYPNDHDPKHVHIRGDDIANKKHGIRVDLDGNPLKGEPKLPSGARKAFKNLREKILKTLGEL